jgi:hypothetical protein
MRAELADRNLRVNLRGNQNLHIWEHRYCLYTRKEGPYFQKVLQSSKNSHRPSSQSENTKLSEKKIYTKKECPGTCKNKSFPFLIPQPLLLHSCASRTFQTQA